MKKKSKLVLYGILIIVFFILGFMVRNSKEGILFDMAIMNFIHKNPNYNIFMFMKTISFLGSGTFLIVLMIIIIIYNFIKRNYYISKLLLASTLGSYVLNFILKYIVNRTRPLEFFLVEQRGLSFPSGHSMVASSMYLTIAYILSSELRYKKTNIYFIAIIIILLMGISRLFLGVHWPTDIIGGYIMGYLVYRLIITNIKDK